MKPTADNSVALTGALETDYARNVEYELSVPVHTRSRIS